MFRLRRPKNPLNNDSPPASGLAGCAPLETSALIIESMPVRELSGVCDRIAAGAPPSLFPPLSPPNSPPPLFPPNRPPPLLPPPPSKPPPPIVKNQHLISFFLTHQEIHWAMIRYRMIVQSVRRRRLMPTTNRVHRRHIRNRSTNRPYFVAAAVAME